MIPNKWVEDLAEEIIAEFEKAQLDGMVAPTKQEIALLITVSVGHNLVGERKPLYGEEKRND